jgi:leader peptidase (prepilin peptidase)/N-methyltransferase
MTTIDTLRAESATTADRVAAAWSDAHPVARRTVFAACVSAAAASTAMPAPAAVRFGVAGAGVFLALAALVDLHERKLPNRLLAAALAAALGGALASFDRDVIVASLIGMLLAGGLMLLVRLSRGLGMGDVKMAGVVGASTGSVALVAAPLALAIASLLASAYGLLARRRRVPLGPALWLGWALALGSSAAGWLR